MCKTEIEEQFERYREYLLQEVQRLTSFIYVYRQIHEMDGARSQAMFFYAPAFFETIAEALFSAIILWTDKLFDHRSQRGFVDFLAFIENNLSIFVLDELQRRTGFADDLMLVREPLTLEVVLQDRKRLESVASLSSFKRRRDKFHAHFDKAYFFQRDKIQEDAPLKWSDLEEIQEVMSQVLNRYSESYDATSYSIKYANINDLAHLLDRVRDGS